MFRSCVSLVLGYLQKQETIILREGSIRQPLGLKSSPLINHFSTPQRTVDSASNFNQPKSWVFTNQQKIASLLFTWLRAPPAVHAAANLLLWYTSDIFSACLANGESLTGDCSETLKRIIAGNRSSKDLSRYILFIRSLGMPFSIKKSISPRCPSFDPQGQHLGDFSQLLHLILRPTRHWRQLLALTILTLASRAVRRGWRQIAFHGSKKFRQNARFTKTNLKHFWSDYSKNTCFRWTLKFKVERNRNTSDFITSSGFAVCGPALWRRGSLAASCRKWLSCLPRGRYNMFVLWSHCSPL